MSRIWITVVERWIMQNQNSAGTPADPQPCPLCGGGAFWPISFVDGSSKKIVLRSEGYHWRACKACGNASPSGPATLDALQQYWDHNRMESESAPVTGAVWNSRLAASEKWAERTFRFVEGFLPDRPGRFLDVACGLGNTVAHFGRKGWDAYGIDADPNTKEFHQKLGVRTSIGQIENLDAGSEYDLISIAHAIYFISNPREFVRKIRGMLSKNGLFLVVISDVLSSTNPARPSLCITWEPTSRSLKYFLQLEGFQVLKTKEMKGSYFILARPGPARRCHPMPILAYLQHATHEWRYLIYGRFIVKGRAVAKKVKSAIFG